MNRPHALALSTLALLACAHRARGPEPATGQTETTAALQSAPIPLEATQPPVEGRIDVCIGGLDGSTVRYETKRDKTRILVSPANDETPKLDVVLDATRGLATLVLDDRREYALLDLETLRKSAMATGSDAITFTGEKRRVAGRDCDVWRVPDRGYAVEACVLTGAPPVDLTPLEEAAGYQAPAWLHTLAAAGAIPLRTATYDGAGPGCVAEIAPMHIHDAAFSAPEGFAKLAP